MGFSFAWDRWVVFVVPVGRLIRCRSTEKVLMQRLCQKGGGG